MSERNDLELEKAPPGKEFNLKEFIFKYLRYLPLLMLGALISLAIAFVRLRYTIPVYSVIGTLIVNKDAKSGGGGGETLEDMFLFSSNVNLKNELEILRSRPLAKRVVNKLGLQISYYNKGKVRSSNIYDGTPIELEILSMTDSAQSFTMEIEVGENKFKFYNTNSFLEYDKIFENSAGVFRIKRIPGRQLAYFSSNIFTIVYNSIEAATENLAGSISTAQSIDQATILDISIETDNIAYGKDVINELMKEYGKMNVEDKREISRVTMQFIDERLDSVKNELGGVESGLLHFREKNDVIDLPEQSRLYYAEYTDAGKQLITQEVQAGVLDYLLQYVSNPGNQFNRVPTNLGLQEPVLLPLIAQYNALQLQRNDLLATTGPNNQEVATTERALLKVKEQIVEALKNVQQSYKIAADKLRKQLNLSKSNIKSVPSKAKQLLDIERQQKIKEELYLFLLQKREEAAISAAATVSSSRPLEEASASNNPVKPNRKNIYLLSLFVGLLVPIAGIAMVELFNDKITQKDEILRHTQIPIVGEIGHAEGQTLVVQAASRKVVAEQFRIMRTNVQYLINKKERPVVLISSSVSGEGKSFIATNYGAVMSLAGKKTVILEFDIRKPRLLKGLNLHAGLGITNYILGNASLDQVILSVPEFPNLFVIGCGPVPPNPSEILLDNQVEKLFTELKSRFEVIVVDTAPVGLVSDAFSLSAYADASLYIVRQGYTVKKQLQMIEELYQQRRLPNMGLLINDIKSSGRYKGYYGYGGAYGSYGYGYGYGYGQAGDYFEQQKSRKNKWLTKWLKKPLD